MGSPLTYLFWNNLKITVRNFYRNRLYATLNVFGLALSYTACFFIAVYILHEYSYEDFHHNAQQVYRVTYESGINDHSTHWARVPEDYVNELPNAISGIQKLVRFQNQEQHYFKAGTQKFKEKHVYVTDPEVFDLFTFELIQGNCQTALAAPQSMVITAQMALKYFGRTDVIGEMLQVMGDWSLEPTSYRITGVMKDLPPNTHLPVDVLMSFENEDARKWWAYIYVLLEPQADLGSISHQLDAFVKAHNEEVDVTTNFHLQPLSSIHLRSNLAREIIPNGSLQNIRTLIFVGMLILFIGLINFANLSSVLAASRTKEIGIRKFLGAGRSQVVQSSLTESIIYSFLSLIVAGLLVSVLSVQFEHFTGISEWKHTVPLLSGMVGMVMVVGILAGSYPAIVASHVSLLQLMKGVGFMSTTARRSVTFKKVMLIFQFGLSSLLLICTVVVREQLQFMAHQTSGLKTESVLAMPGVPDRVTKDFSSFKQALLKVPGIEQVSSCLEVPSREIRDTGPFKVEGLHNTKQEAPHFDVQIVDQDFFDLMNLELLAGSSFPQRVTLWEVPEFTTDYDHIDYLGDQPRAYLINETAMRQLGWTIPDQAIGQIASWSIGDMQLAKGKIVGVIADYYQESMKNEVDPTVYLFEPIWLRTFLVRTTGDQGGETLNAVHATWDDYFPNYPMTYHYLDEMYERLYRQEQRQLDLLMLLSGMAIMIAFIGLVTIVAYAIRLRLKELAIRKVLGARVNAIIHMLCKEYAWMLIGGWLLAVPVAYYLTTWWLSSFAYQSKISVWLFASTFLGIGLVLIAAILTHVTRVARVNPSSILHND